MAFMISQIFSARQCKGDRFSSRRILSNISMMKILGRLNLQYMTDNLRSMSRTCQTIWSASQQQARFISTVQVHERVQMIIKPVGAFGFVEWSSDFDSSGSWDVPGKNLWPMHFSMNLPLAASILYPLKDSQAVRGSAWLPESSVQCGWSDE